MALRTDMHLVWPAREERHVSGKGIIFDYDPSTILLLLEQNVAEQASSESLAIAQAFRKLARDHSGHEWICIDLTMRMVKCDADLLAFVLEDKDILDEIKL